MNNYFRLVIYSCDVIHSLDLEGANFYQLQCTSQSKLNKSTRELCLGQENRAKSILVSYVYTFAYRWLMTE